MASKKSTEAKKPVIIPKVETKAIPKKKPAKTDLKNVEYDKLESEWNRRQEKIDQDLETTQAEGLQDRMMRYRRNTPCPSCGAHPTVCEMRQPGYSAYRCRQCGTRYKVVDQELKKGTD